LGCNVALMPSSVRGEGLGALSRCGGVVCMLLLWCLLLIVNLAHGNGHEHAGSGSSWLAAAGMAISSTLDVSCKLLAGCPAAWWLLVCTFLPSWVWPPSEHGGRGFKLHSMAGPGWEGLRRVPASAAAGYSRTSAPFLASVAALAHSWKPGATQKVLAGG
jgi:hypothetical protein